jgi:hypothetical protein
VDSAAISDLFSGLAMLAGQAPVMWAADVLHTGRTLVDPWVESPGLIGAEVTVADALSRCGMIVGSAAAASIWALSRFLADR